MSREMVGAKTVLERVAAINARLYEAALPADLDPQVVSDFTEDTSQKKKKSDFEESKKLNVLLEAFRTISNNVVTSEGKAEETETVNLFSKVKELMDKSKNPGFNQSRPRSASLTKSDIDKQSQTNQIKMASSFVPAISEFVDLEDTKKNEDYKKKETFSSTGRLDYSVHEDNLFDSAKNDKDSNSSKDHDSMLDFYQNFELCRTS